MTRLRRFGSLMVALLRELADENAYQRYLVRNCREHSPQEWRKFSDKRLRAKYLRPKCC
jgi:predicted secreted acid phosphatase